MIVTERIMRVPFLDIKNVRIVCQGTDCGKIVELPIAELRDDRVKSKCQFCGNSFSIGERHPLYELWRAHDHLTEIASRMHVEFVIPSVD